MKIDFNPGINSILPVDPVNVKAAEAGKAKGKKQAGGAPPPPKTPDEIAAFMRSLGLEPTNNAESDFAAITAKLDAMEAQATTQAELDNVQSLRNTFAALTSDSPTSDSNSKPIGQDPFAGQNQLASLNKFFIENKKV